MTDRNDNDFFPMLDGPPITWKTAKLIYRMYRSSQSLEKIAERGGFGWSEVKLMFEEFQMDEGDYAAKCLKHIPTLEAEEGPSNGC